MRRREFVATGLTGLIASPALAAAAPGVMVEIELNGQTYRYDSATGTDLGPYIDPQGQFTQDCIRVDHPQLPLSVFIRPDRGMDRLEIVFELGRMWAGIEPQHLPQYQARIIRGSATLASIDVPAHYWFSRWRWQSAPRPIRATAAQLMGQWLMPQLSDRLRPVTAPIRSAPSYSPMGLAGLAAYMGSTGERPEIGLLTESQAQYLCTGNEAAMATLFAQAEAAGTYPWNFRDEKTNAPLNTLAYPRATTYGPKAGSPHIRTLRAQAAQWDSAHQPALSYLPFLLTGDPYHLEQMQLIATANVLWRPWDYRYRTTQVRGEAWAMRTWAQIVIVTPEKVPQWMMPKAHWQKLLNSYRDWYMAKFVTNPAPPHAIFRSTEQEFGDDRDGLLGGTYTSTWQEDFLAAVLGWMVLMGHSDWRPVFEWKIGSTIARTNGQSGWPRAHCVTYRMIMRSGPDTPWVQNWKDAWDLTAAGLKLTVSDPGQLDLKQLFYFPYTRGALVLAKHLQIPGADACLNWADAELVRAVAAKKPLGYKWALV
ncbi:MAG TPA: hypothetical protein VJL82_07010 [Rhizomicrobium sp.]|nr:hypothetical protein [Rhizomicrobium sp.]